MAVDGLTDPHNLGAIVRSAESLGAHGLVLPQRRTAGLTGTVAKVAAGALEHLPVARVVNLNRALDSLKQEGYRVIGLAEEGTVGLHEADLDGPLVVVTASEGPGLSLLTRKTCDQLIRIPLRGATPSLNASVATALMLYEIARRGWMKSLSGSAPAPRIVRPQLPAPAPRVISSAAADDDLLDSVSDDVGAVADGVPGMADAAAPMAAVGSDEASTNGFEQPQHPLTTLEDQQASPAIAAEDPADRGADVVPAEPPLAEALPAPAAGLELSLATPGPEPLFQGNIQL